MARAASARSAESLQAVPVSRRSGRRTARRASRWRLRPTCTGAGHQEFGRFGGVGGAVVGDRTSSACAFGEHGEHPSRGRHPASLPHRGPVPRPAPEPGTSSGSPVAAGDRGSGRLCCGPVSTRWYRLPGRRCRRTLQHAGRTVPLLGELTECPGLPRQRLGDGRSAHRSRLAWSRSAVVSSPAQRAGRPAHRPAVAAVGAVAAVSARGCLRAASAEPVSLRTSAMDAPTAPLRTGPPGRSGP